MKYDKVPTGKQREDFVDNGGAFCPHCGSSDIFNRGTLSKDPYIYEIGCYDCGGRWIELLTVTGLMLEGEKPIVLAERALKDV